MQETMPAVRGPGRISTCEANLHQHVLLGGRIEVGKECSYGGPPRRDFEASPARAFLMVLFMHMYSICMY
jgi:hypothetical protein